MNLEKKCWDYKENARGDVSQYENYENKSDGNDYVEGENYLLYSC